jgi:hypothetical protein
MLFGGQRIGPGERLFLRAPSKERTRRTPAHRSPRRCSPLCLRSRSVAFSLFALFTHKRVSQTLPIYKYEDIAACWRDVAVDANCHLLLYIKGFGDFGSDSYLNPLRPKAHISSGNITFIIIYANQHVLTF